MHGEPGHVYDPSRPLGDRSVRFELISCVKLFYILKMKKMKWKIIKYFFIIIFFVLLKCSRNNVTSLINKQPALRFATLNTSE